MIRQFCDICGLELTGLGNAVSNRIKVRHGRLLVEVIVGIDSTWNSGHACRLCVREALKKGETLSPSLVTTTARNDGSGCAP